MGTDEDEISMDTNIPKTVNKVSVPVEKHNLKVRRRNVLDASNFEPQENEGAKSDGRVSVTSISDSTKASFDVANVRIPDVVNFGSSGKQNGVLSPEDDDNFADDDFGDTGTLTAKERSKINVIRRSIAKEDLTLEDLKLLGCSTGGLVNDDIRRVLWPKLLQLSGEIPPSTNGLETIHNSIPNVVYHQILNDVARSGSHMSQNATQGDIKRFHEQLTQLMCWVLHRHSTLNYYQGYNDIAATVLLVMGLESGLRILESISLDFLQRFMEKTMEKVNQELFYIFALLERVHPMLLQHLENVELFPHFALAEYTTWYAHKYAENRKLLHRLFDYFLGSPPLMPLYLSTVIVAHRATEIFSTTPDMGHTHKVLCTLPDDLPFESLLVEANDLYHRYPPESISKDVTEYDQRRKFKEQEWKAKAKASRQERERQRQLRIVQSSPRIPYRIRSYKTITVVTILALGLYAFLKSSSGLN